MYSAVMVLAFAIFIATTGEASAWGAGMHIVQGSFILENLKMIRPEIAAILAAAPLDYMYGCISADIFIGKGYKRRDDHCHNWNVGFKVLEGASTEPTKAYAYGYLSHLAADVVAHNHMIPNLLYATLAGKKLGHVYWEFRADRFIQKRYWRLATEVVSGHHHESDNLIKEVMNRSDLRFGAKKMIFKRALHASDLTAWKQAVEASISENNPFSKNEISTLNNYSINLIIDLLQKESDSIPLLFDPVGTDNTIEAKKMRKSHKKEKTLGKNGAAFPVPEKIKSIDYIDCDTIRF